MWDLSCNPCKTVSMSNIAEIEAAIEKLSAVEFAELAVWMAARRRARRNQSKDIRKAMDKVFTHHAPLLRKLAQ